jgi:lipooligosaccharide transport system ATP-binding protein
MASSVAAEPIVSARGLVKRYGAFEAVRGIDFDVFPGECFGMLGPNGAGKSSTIRMLSCLTDVTAGTLTVFGEDAHPGNLRIKRRIGVVSQDDFLDPSLTVEENLILHGLFYGLTRQQALRRTDELLEFMQLQDRRRQPVRELSGGMRRRLVIARGLIGNPALVVLDEPTTGLDPQARLLVWSKLKELTRSGVTLVITTHYMEEAARLADRLVIMDQGRVLEAGSPQDLVDRVAGTHAVDLWDVDPEALRPAVGDVARVEHRGDLVTLLTRSPDHLLDRLRHARLQPNRYLLRPANLEDVFLLLTGAHLRD